MRIIISILNIPSSWTHDGLVAEEGKMLGGARLGRLKWGRAMTKQGQRWPVPRRSAKNFLRIAEVPFSDWHQETILCVLVIFLRTEPHHIIK